MGFHRIPAALHDRMPPRLLEEVSIYSPLDNRFSLFEFVIISLLFKKSRTPCWNSMVKHRGAFSTGGRSSHSSSSENWLGQLGPGTKTRPPLPRCLYSMYGQAHHRTRHPLGVVKGSLVGVGVRRSGNARKGNHSFQLGGLEMLLNQNLRLRLK